MIKIDETIGERRATHRFNGIALRLERRRYGHTTYTWVEWWDGEKWQSCGDPWPTINVPKKDLEAIFGKE